MNDRARITRVPPIWLLAMLVSVGPLSTDLYLPALPMIASAFGTDAAGVQWTLSGFLLGFAPSQLVYGPIADRFGRRPAMLLGLVIYLIASIGCALADTLPQLVAARVVQAFGACAGPVVARAMVRDAFPADRAASVFATMAGLVAVAPALGPVLGGLLTAGFGWRGTFWLLALLSALSLLLSSLVLRETIVTPDRTALDPARLVTAYLSLLRNRWFIVHAGISTATYSGLFCFISGSSHVIQQGLGLGPRDFGFVFGATVVGFALGSAIAGWLSPRLGNRRMVRLGAIWCLVCGWLGPVLLATIGPRLETVVAPVVLFLIGFAFVQPNAQAAAIGPFPLMAGRASALLGCLQWGVAALGGLILGAVLDPFGWAMAGGLAIGGSLAAIGLLLLPPVPRA